MARVKICGIRDEAALSAALDGRADLVGFVFFEKSPRYISPEAAAPLADHIRGMAASVALVVDAGDAELDRIVRVVNPDLLQLHGSETPERTREIRARYGKPVMKAIKVATAEDARLALDYADAADLILFDAKPPPDATLPGGNGIAFDWRALEGVSDKVSFMLSGGLTPENVVEAIRLTGATVVDVSSGVETAPGIKSPDLIRRFLHAAKTAKQLA